MSPRTFIYARQSLANEEGIARQLARCSDLVARRGWRVAETFTDDATSATKSRASGTAWAALLAAIRPGDRVVAVDVDRLLRSLGDLVTLLDSGAVVVTVDGEVDLSTADGEFRATLLASLARFEVRRKSERQLRANAHRHASGRPVPTRRRYGYEPDGMTPREPEASVVRRLYAHVRDGGSLKSASDALKAEGVSPAPGRAWSPSRVGATLKNPHYAGRVVRRGVVLPSEHVVPIIDEETFETVVAILNDPTRRTSPGPSPRHLLSGLTYCGVCGATLRYMRGYICRVDTSHVQIKGEFLEDVVCDAVATALLSSGPDLFLPPEGTPGDVRDLVTAHADNLARVRDVLDDRDAGLLPPEVARERLAALRDARAVVEADLEAPRASSSDAYALHETARALLPDADAVSMTEWAELKDTVLARFRALSLDARRGLITALLYVQVDKGRGKERVRVVHLLATHLNAVPDAAGDAGRSARCAP